MAVAGTNNALAWAHFRLRGGWNHSAVVSLGLVILLASLAYGSHRLNPENGRTIFGWATGLLIIQGACVLIYIPGRIGSTIRQDVMSKMIESHRLMPMPPMHAVAGYILGAATQPLVFFAFNFVLGGIVALIAGVDVTRYAFANVVLLAFAAFVWVLAAYGALAARLGGGMFFFVIFIPYITQGVALSTLPGVVVLLSPIIGTSIFDLRTPGIALPATYAISFAAQAYFAAVCFLAAARKYRSPDAIGTSSVVGMCLLFGWVAVSCIGLREWEDFRPRGGWLPGGGGIDVNVCVAASIIASLLIAISPVCANALERTRWRRHELLNDPYPLRPPIALPFVILLAAALPLAIPFATEEPLAFTGAMLAKTAYVIAITLIGLYYFFRWNYAATNSAVGPAIVWLIATWLVPIGIDMVRYSLADFGEVEAIAGFSTCSPAGSLLVLWKDGNVIDVKPGLFVQAVVAAIPVVLWLAFPRRDPALTEP